MPYRNLNRFFARAPANSHLAETYYSLQAFARALANSHEFVSKWHPEANSSTSDELLNKENPSQTGFLQIHCVVFNVFFPRDTEALRTRTKVGIQNIRCSGTPGSLRFCYINSTFVLQSNFQQGAPRIDKNILALMKRIQPPKTLRYSNLNRFLLELQQTHI